MHTVLEYVMFPAFVHLAFVADTLEKYALGDMSVLVQSHRQEVTTRPEVEEHFPGLHEIRLYHSESSHKGQLRYPVKVRQEILLDVPVELLVRDFELDFAGDELRQIRGRHVRRR